MCVPGTQLGTYRSKIYEYYLMAKSWTNVEKIGSKYRSLVELLKTFRQNPGLQKFFLEAALIFEMRQNS